MVSVTLNVAVPQPSDVNTCEGFCKLDVADPSPKFQEYVYGPVPATEEVNPTEAPEHGLSVNVNVGTGCSKTVIAMVVELLQPPEVTVYTIVAVPAATPVITPLELIVAIFELVVVHVPPPVVEVAVIVPPTQSDVAVSDIGLTVGALTTTACVTLVVHPFNPVTVYEIIAVPELTPVTTPVLEPTVAMFVAVLDQTPPTVLLVKVVVALLQTVNVPSISATVGTANTVTIFVADAVQLVCELVKL